MDLVESALAAQPSMDREGFSTRDDALMGLLAGVPIAELPSLVRDLLTSDVIARRQLGARILNAAEMPSLTDAARSEIAMKALKRETSPVVLRWLIRAVGLSRQQSGLSAIMRFVMHEDANVRFAVPDALSMCAETFDEIAEALLELTRDVDEDVRWSAVFELAAWFRDTGDRRARERLMQVRDQDEDEATREVASASLQGGP